MLPSVWRKLAIVLFVDNNNTFCFGVLVISHKSRIVWIVCNLGYYNVMIPAQHNESRRSVLTNTVVCNICCALKWGEFDKWRIDLRYKSDGWWWWRYWIRGNESIDNGLNETSSHDVHCTTLISINKGRHLKNHPVTQRLIVILSKKLNPGIKV